MNQTHEEILQILEDHPNGASVDDVRIALDCRVDYDTCRHYLSDLVRWRKVDKVPIRPPGRQIEVFPGPVQRRWKYRLPE